MTTTGKKRPVTDEDILEIIRLRESGVGVPEICARMRRGYTTVAWILRGARVATGDPVTAYRKRVQSASAQKKLRLRPPEPLTLRGDKGHGALLLLAQGLPLDSVAERIGAPPDRVRRFLGEHVARL